jgi:hypothetical protein
MEHKISIAYSSRSLIKFLVITLIFAHWVRLCAFVVLVSFLSISSRVCCALPLPQLACMYRLIVLFEPEGDENWISAYGLDPENVKDCYIAAMYWSIMTITTIGYGDIPAKTTPERALVCVCMLVGAGTFAYIVGSFCGIVASLGKETSEYQSNMDSLNEFMEESAVPVELRHRIRSYYSYSR